jgi:hypothetical protein
METIAMSVTDAGSSISATELAEFLFLFRGANVALSQIVPNSKHHPLRQPTEDEIKECKLHLGSFSPKQLDSFFDSHEAPDLLEISRISRESPLEITVMGCGLLLALGVVLSGGKIQVGSTGVKADLPPLGKGIKCLLEALGIHNPLKVGFGIREVTVKLNKREFEELMIPVTGSGGFQSFFRGLQNRINKQTRKLTLSQADLERIYRHKSEPQKGGFQARLEKIFGRHLPDSHQGKMGVSSAGRHDLLDDVVE